MRNASHSARVLFAIALVALATVVPADAAATRTQMFYSVSAHPDDELNGWAMIQNRPDTYVVWVIMTQGERTTSCLSPRESVPPSGVGVDDAIYAEGFVPTDPITSNKHPGGDRYHGPYKYQGRGSPVGQPNKGERHPLRNPWLGRGTQACKDARVASWHWFLDDMAAFDRGLPSFQIVEDPKRDDDYNGRFCVRGVPCADVWANNEGARVSFDGGDGKLTPAKVIASLQALRANRARWGIRRLPESGVLANAYYSGERTPLCVPYTNVDHGAVQDALFATDVHAGQQFGGMCAADDRFLTSPGPVAYTDPRTLVLAHYVDPVTEHRIGAYQVNYGWVFETYTFNGSLDPTFWKRFG